MKNISEHTFHIPVMGLGFSVDTPVKVARFGISSVVSIMQDELLEQMREYHCKQIGEHYHRIPTAELDHRALRVASYLNLLKRIVDSQVEKMKAEPFEEERDIVKYFRLLPEDAPSKELYSKMMMMQGEEKINIQNKLREMIVPGSIDVNIMTKVDNPNYSKNGDMLPIEYTDAISALRGFAKSNFHSSIVFSAGLNTRLFSYIENLPNFYPDEHGSIEKKIILKVSDYRSAIIQGKLLAKKGLLVHEFRIESGLNCGGHAFPTDGMLIGPILEEFKQKRQEITNELLTMCNHALQEKNLPLMNKETEIRVTVQGGIGTVKEDKFLREYYNLNSTGWGSPFLLVPEATNVDATTLNDLASAKQEDYFLSDASPLGIPFNNFRPSSAEAQRKERIRKNRPGSPCYKKLLTFNTEFTERPICTASREYQAKKLKSLDESLLPLEELARQKEEIMSKDCLCDGLAAPALVKNGIPEPHKLYAVTICPGPNLAYFSKIFSLEEMVGHIYGRFNALNSMQRSHVFINELKMYIEYLKKDVSKNMHSLSTKQIKHFSLFKKNLLDGIEYYKNLLPSLTNEADEFKKKMRDELEALNISLKLAVEGIV